LYKDCKDKDGNLVKEDGIIKFKTKEFPDVIYREMLISQCPGYEQHYWHKGYAPPRLRFKKGRIANMASEVLFPETVNINGKSVPYEYMIRLEYGKAGDTEEELSTITFPVSEYPNAENFMALEKKTVSIAGYSLPILEEVAKTVNVVGFETLDYLDIPKESIVKLQLIRRPKETLLTKEISEEEAEVNASTLQFRSIEDEVSQQVAENTKILYEYYFGVSKYDALHEKVKEVSYSVAYLPVQHKSLFDRKLENNAPTRFESVAKRYTAHDRYFLLRGPEFGEQFDQYDINRIRLNSHVSFESKLNGSQLNQHIGNALKRWDNFDPYSKHSLINSELKFFWDAYETEGNLKRYYKNLLSNISIDFPPPYDGSAFQFSEVDNTNWYYNVLPARAEEEYKFSPEIKNREQDLFRRGFTSNSVLGNSNNFGKNITYEFAFQDIRQRLLYHQASIIQKFHDYYSGKIHPNHEDKKSFAKMLRDDFRPPQGRQAGAISGGSSNKSDYYKLNIDYYYRDKYLSMNQRMIKAVGNAFVQEKEAMGKINLVSTVKQWAELEKEPKRRQIAAPLFDYDKFGFFRSNDIKNLTYLYISRVDKNGNTHPLFHWSYVHKALVKYKEDGNIEKRINGHNFNGHFGDLANLNEIQKLKQDNASFNIEVVYEQGGSRIIYDIYEVNSSGSNKWNGRGANHPIGEAFKNAKAPMNWVPQRIPGTIEVGRYDVSGDKVSSVFPKSENPFFVRTAEDELERIVYYSLGETNRRDILDESISTSEKKKKLTLFEQGSRANYSVDISYKGWYQIKTSLLYENNKENNENLFDFKVQIGKNEKNITILEDKEDVINHTFFMQISEEGEQLMVLEGLGGKIWIHEMQFELVNLSAEQIAELEKKADKAEALNEKWVQNSMYRDLNIIIPPKFDIAQDANWYQKKIYDIVKKYFWDYEKLSKGEEPINKYAFLQPTNNIYSTTRIVKSIYPEFRLFTSRHLRKYKLKNYTERTLKMYLWRFERYENSPYYYISNFTRDGLPVVDWKLYLTSNNDDIVLHKCNSKNKSIEGDQLYKIEEIEEGRYLISNKNHPGEYLYPDQENKCFIGLPFVEEDGFPLKLEDIAITIDPPLQDVPKYERLQSIGGKSFGISFWGTVYFQGGISNLVKNAKPVEVGRKTASGSIVSLASDEKANEWLIQAEGDYFVIKDRTTNSVLKGISRTSATSLVPQGQFDANDRSMLWKIERKEDGDYLLRLAEDSNFFLVSSTKQLALEQLYNSSQDLKEFSVVIEPALEHPNVKPFISDSGKSINDKSYALAFETLIDPTGSIQSQENLQGIVDKEDGKKGEFMLTSANGQNKEWWIRPEGEYFMLIEKGNVDNKKLVQRSVGSTNPYNGTVAIDYERPENDKANPAFLWKIEKLNADKFLVTNAKENNVCLVLSSTGFLSLYTIDRKQTDVDKFGIIIKSGLGHINIKEFEKPLSQQEKSVGKKAYQLTLSALINNNGDAIGGQENMGIAAKSTSPLLLELTDPTQKNNDWWIQPEGDYFVVKDKNTQSVIAASLIGKDHLGPGWLDIFPSDQIALDNLKFLWKIEKLDNGKLLFRNANYPATFLLGSRHGLSVYCAYSSDTDMERFGISIYPALDHPNIKAFQPVELNEAKKKSVNENSYQLAFNAELDNKGEIRLMDDQSLLGVVKKEGSVPLKLEYSVANEKNNDWWIQPEGEYFVIRDKATGSVLDGGMISAEGTGKGFTGMIKPNQFYKNFLQHMWKIEKLKNGKHLISNAKYPRAYLLVDGTTGLKVYRPSNSETDDEKFGVTISPAIDHPNIKEFDTFLRDIENKEVQIRPNYIYPDWKTIPEMNPQKNLDKDETGVKVIKKVYSNNEPGQRMVTRKSDLWKFIKTPFDDKKDVFRIVHAGNEQMIHAHEAGPSDLKRKQNGKSECPIRFLGKNSYDLIPDSGSLWEVRKINTDQYLIESVKYPGYYLYYTEEKTLGENLAAGPLSDDSEQKLVSFELIEK